jgi:hypothetical protein
VQSIGSNIVVAVIFIVIIDGGGGGGSIGWLRMGVEAFSGSLAGLESGAKPSISAIFLIILERYS